MKLTYGYPHALDLPSYMVDALRSLAGYEAVVDATDLLMSPAYGLRAQCSSSEIAYFEYTNYRASEAMKRMHFGLRLGMTDHELVSEARYDGLPLACHITLKTGPDRIGLSSPSGDVIERGYPWSANISYWGSNVCRAGWVAESAVDLPEPAADYVEAFAGPYFEAMAEWLNALRIGETGGAFALTDPELAAVRKVWNLSQSRPPDSFRRVAQLAHLRQLSTSDPFRHGHAKRRYPVVTGLFFYAHGRWFRNRRSRATR